MKKKLSFMVALILMVNGIGATTGVKAYDSTVNEVENVLEEKDTNGNNQETKDIKDENSSLEDTEVVKETSNLGNNTNEEIIARALSEKTYKVMDNFLVNGSCVILTENIICDNLEMDGGSTTYLDLNGYELIVMGNVEQRSGCIDINNGILNIYGDYNLSGSLGMFRENDYLVVGGDLLIEGNNLNCFRFGILELKGNLMVTGIIDQSENFKLVFSGKKEQVVDVAGGGCFSNFNYIDTSKSAGVRFQTPIRLRDLSGLENVVGTLILEVSLITLNSDVTLNCEIKFQNNTTVYLNGYTFNINNNLKVDDCTNYIYLQGGTLNVNNIEINGLNIYIDGGGTLSAKNIKQNDGKMNIEDGWLNIAENYIITEDGLLYSTNEDNHILVGGDFIVENLTLSKSNDSFKGILEIKGNLSAIQIYLSGKSQVVFSGEKEQIVKIQYPEESRFLYIDTTKSAGVKFETPVNIGYLSRLDNVVGKLTLTGVCFLSQDLTPNFELAFTENISLSFINECTLNLGNRDLELKGGTISINGGVLNVNNLNQSGGSMNVTNGTLNVAGNYNLTDSGALKMVCEKDYVFVAGDLLINSDNLLDFNTFTNGTLVLKGNLTQKKGEIDRSNRNFLQEKNSN